MSRVRFKTLDEVYKKYPTNTLSKFKRIANRYGLTDDEAKEYLNSHVVHDQHIPPPKFMHIYSKIQRSFQMDTFICDAKSATQIGNPDYLMFINVNTRMAYAYEISCKGAKEELRSLNEFIKEEPECKSITSDEDTAYLSKFVIYFMREHNIIYTKTTTDNDHKKLGIINRFMRTIRNMKVNEPNNDILTLVDSYNDMPHRSLNYKSPNEITEEDEIEYINKMEKQVNPYDFKPGDIVRVVLDKSPLTKHRSNLSKQSYIVNSKDGNQFLIRSTDVSVDTIPGYKLVKATNNVP
ncbi:hypothetical protein M9Y10_029418 [Tritrichomonas musculus]|uniref:Integrase catalytic domain-containing protein n=1 Tax=Tritrichomonas musculus TaxID=1915356 RepID=A0ABR2KM47_9EUKA